MNDIKYFVYIRKSTDEEDRQVLSLDAQLHELKQFAEKEGLHIIETFIEKKTAKVPGRDIFNQMLNKIENGLPHPCGIIAWHPDRLSRNSVDGGRLIYLLDTGKLVDLKFPTFAFDNSPSGKFFLSIGLSNAKYYVDNLSENVKRGNRQKLRRGEWPGQKPFGYIYDHRLRNIVPEPNEAKVVQKIFQDYSTGRYTLKTISLRLADFGEKSKSGCPRSNWAIETLLRNKLYMGMMEWNGELHEGKFQSLIAPQLFNKVQKILDDRRKPRHGRQKHDFPFTGIFRCACGAMISAQWTHGNGGTYRYYRCSKKMGACTEKYIQEDELKRKIIDIVQTIAVSSEWISFLTDKLKEETKNETASLDVLKEAIDKKLTFAQIKLDKLLEGYLDNLIDPETYARKKEELLAEKFQLKHDRDSLLSKQMSNWNEPMRDFILDLNFASKIEKADNLEEIAHFFRKIGTNHTLSAKIPSVSLREPYVFARDCLLVRRDRAERISGISPEDWERPLVCAE